MNYKPLFIEDDFAVAKIKWHNPVLLKDNRSEFSDTNKFSNDFLYFYKIIAIRKDKDDFKYRLLYIGYTGRELQKRLNDKDHLIKQENIKLENQGYKLYVSAGELIDFQNHRNNVKPKDLETLLIYSHKNNQFQKLANKSNAVSHNINTSILIENTGYIKDGMYKKVSYGLFHYV